MRMVWERILLTHIKHSAPVFHRTSIYFVEMFSVRIDMNGIHRQHVIFRDNQQSNDILPPMTDYHVNEHKPSVYHHQSKVYSY